MSRASNGPVPERIGRYDVLLRIASGGMAAVYLARSRGVGGFQREVAIKLTHPHLRASPDFAADLIEEAKLAVRIRHPNVVPIVDVGEDDKGVFLVMDYVEGDSLSGLLRRSNEAGVSMPLGVGMRILIDALSGLHAAHELLDEAGKPLGIVHRDFTPQNLLIGVDGVARLADFGIARAAGRVGLTRAGTVKGKITYMAPEQARSRPLDRRCDVWAAGVVAWELLAGRRLHETVENEVAMLFQIVTEVPPRLRTIVPEVAPAFEDAVARALTLDPDQRTPSAAVLARELTAACRAHGQLAELEEVGAFVSRVAGAKLKRRRARIAESVTIRAAAIQRGSVSRPEIPIEVSSEIEINIDETPESAPAQSYTGSIIELSHAVRFDGNPEVLRTDTTSVTPSKRPSPLPKRRGPMVALSMAGGVVLLACVALGWTVRARATRGPHATAVDSRTSPAPSSIETAAAATSTESSVARPRESKTGQLQVHATERVSSLRIDDRVVRLASPTQDAVVDILAEEHSRDITVRASASDGRQAVVTIPAGTTTATLVFPQARATQSRPLSHAPPPTTTKPPPTPGTTKPPPKLAGSPY